jgi:hypothetical protein
MRKIIIIVMALFLAAGIVAAQDLLPLGRDLATMLEELGQDIVPYLMQNALAGDGIGMAELPEKDGFFLAFSAGAVLANGIGTFLGEEDTFELLDVDGMLREAFGGGSGEEYYELVQELVPYPNLRLALGFRFFFKTELLLQFSIFPQAATDMIAEAMDASGLTFNRMNAGLRVRKALLHDGHGFPAVSLGLGYVFSAFNMGYALPEDFSQDISGSELTLGGDLEMHTVLHSFGVDLAVSKKLGFFIPYIAVSPWYQWARFNGTVSDFVATAGAGDYTAQGGRDPSAEVSVLDLSLLLSGGFELKLGGLVLQFDASYSLTGRSLGANLGMRLQL